MMGRPIVFGPNMQNFEAISKALLSREGALCAANAAELEQALIRLLSDSKFAQETGEKAHTVVCENLGSIERTVDMIIEKLDDKGVYVTG
jgi:3-deoxy-D-manno-octulosonic-acid transferase